jgi:hypothetical protein
MKTGKWLESEYYVTKTTDECINGKIAFAKLQKWQVTSMCRLFQA